MIDYFAHEVTSSHIHTGNDSSTIIYLSILGLFITGLLGLTIYLLSRPNADEVSNREDS